MRFWGFRNRITCIISTWQNFRCEVGGMDTRIISSLDLTDWFLGLHTSVPYLQDKLFQRATVLMFTFHLFMPKCNIIMLQYKIILSHELSIYNYSHKLAISLSLYTFLNMLLEYIYRTRQIDCLYCLTSHSNLFIIRPYRDTEIYFLRVLF